MIWQQVRAVWLLCCIFPWETVKRVAMEMLKNNAGRTEAQRECSSQRWDWRAFPLLNYLFPGCHFIVIFVFPSGTSNLPHNNPNQWWTFAMHGDLLRGLILTYLRVGIIQHWPLCAESCLCKEPAPVVTFCCHKGKSQKCTAPQSQKHFKAFPKAPRLSIL